MYYYNGAQRYEQFLQVGQLYWALILLSVALFRAPLYLRSSWCYICIKNFFAYILLFTFQWAEPGEIGPWPGWQTIILQCYDPVGWVIWPVKSSSKWPINNVSSGTLNTTIPYSCILADCLTCESMIHDYIDNSVAWICMLMNEYDVHLMSDMIWWFYMQ